MKYYKIINNSQFIGVITSEDFRRYNPISKLLLSSSENKGEYVRYGNELYRDQWMKAPVTDTLEYQEARIIEIGEEEYNNLNVIIEENLPVPDDTIIDEPIQLVVPIVNADDVITIEFAREEKINALSKVCRTTIEDGFDLEIRGETRHFSLSTQDQLNLMSLSAIAQTQQLIPYHADGESCEFYTANEINEIIAAATTFKNYHLVYYNALKAYVNALETAEEVSAITYGTPIPEEYKTDVLKVLEY